MQLDTLGRAAVSLGWLILVVVAPGGFGGFLIQVRNRNIRRVCADLWHRSRRRPVLWIEPVWGGSRHARRRPDEAPPGAGRNQPAPVGPPPGAEDAIAVLPQGSDIALSLAWAGARLRRRHVQSMGSISTSAVGPDPRDHRSERCWKDDLVRDRRRIHRSRRWTRDLRRPGCDSDGPRGTGSQRFGSVVPEQRIVPDADRPRDSHGRV